MTLAADALLKEECGTIAALIPAHALERPAATALIQDGTRLDYAGLDRLVDRVAAALQRDGLSPGDIVAVCAKTSIAYAAVFLGALRAGVAVAPLAPSSTPRAIASMVADCDAKLFFLDETVARALANVELPVRAERVALDGSANGQPFDDVARPRRRSARTGEGRSRARFQHHLFVGHDGRAQGYRPLVCDALVAAHARHRQWLQRRIGDDRLHAALFEHHAGELPAHARLRRAPPS